MYVFFENHKDPEGNVVATDVISSSYEDNFRINWSKDKIQFEIMKKMLKTPDIAVRTYSDVTHMWSYLGTAGFFLLKTLEEAFSKLPQMRIEFRYVKDLEEAVLRGSIFREQSTKFDPANFYYNRFSPAEELTKETAAPLLAKLLECEPEDISKSLWFRAVRRYHPDLWSDKPEEKIMSAKLSEINMLWRIYNGGS